MAIILVSPTQLSCRRRCNGVVWAAGIRGWRDEAGLPSALALVGVERSPVPGEQVVYGLG